MEYRPSEIEGQMAENMGERELFKAMSKVISQNSMYWTCFLSPGAGLHVGHPLSYIVGHRLALQAAPGFMVLHPMTTFLWSSRRTIRHQNRATSGRYDPGEPARYRNNSMLWVFHSIGALGTDPISYYRWTQWIFLKLFDSWYDTSLAKRVRFRNWE